MDYSKISKVKEFGYDLSERNFFFGFVPLMKIWKLQNAPSCLPTLEIKEVIPETEVDSGHPEYIMEEVVAHPVAYEDEHIAE